MELIKQKTHFDFMGFRWYAYVFSAIVIAACVYIWIAQGDSKWGTDYRGGHELVIEFKSEVQTDDLRKLLEEKGIEDAIVQSFEVGSNDYSVRLGDPGDSKTVKSKVSAALGEKYSGQFEIIKTDYVGPSVSVELRRKGLYAVIFGLLGILIYISFRFEVSFAIGAVVAIFHDVIVSTGIYLYTGHTLSGSALAAALTILGYSVNDTIVIFDRVREEVLKRKTFVLSDLLNDAINQMLPRTIITHVLTFFSALALYLFGGGAIADLTLFLLVGIVAGAYSTIFIASPVVLAWEGLREKRRAAAESKNAAKPKSAVKGNA